MSDTLTAEDSALTLARLLAARDDIVSRIRMIHESGQIVPTPQPSVESSHSVSKESTDEQLHRALSEARHQRVENIKLLSRYNDIKDVAQGLMGLIAEQKGCRVKQVMEELGIDTDD